MTFDPTKPVRTRDGREARILAADIKHPQFPIVAAVTHWNGTESAYLFRSDGTISLGSVYPEELVLVNIPERVERWVNVFPIKYGWSATNHKTKTDADSTGVCRVGLVKLVFENDKLVEVTLEKSDD